VHAVFAAAPPGQTEAPVTATDPILRQVARGSTHLVKWVNYHWGAGTQPASRPARVTVFSSFPTGDDAAGEGLDLLRRAA
jgi:hypothetical protein